MINYIEFGGQNRPYSFSYRTLKEHTQWIASHENKDTLDQDEYLMFIAFRNGCKKLNEKPDFKAVDITDWIDDDFETFNKLRGEAMRHYMEWQQADQQIKAESLGKSNEILEQYKTNVEELLKQSQDNGEEEKKTSA